jgi:hypothetical protein
LGLVANLVTCVANNNHPLLLLALGALGRLLDAWLRNRLHRVLRNDSPWWIVKLSLACCGGGLSSFPSPTLNL